MALVTNPGTGNQFQPPLEGPDSDTNSNAPEMPISSEHQKSPNVPPNIPKPYAQCPTLPTRSHVYHLRLGGGVIFEYTEEDFADPPVLSNLVSTPGILFSIWDDESPSWKGSSPLIIRSQPIAVKYWNKFYTSFKGRSRVWSGIKQSWSSWKVSFYSFRFFAYRPQYPSIRF